MRVSGASSADSDRYLFGNDSLAIVAKPCRTAPAANPWCKAGRTSVAHFPGDRYHSWPLAVTTSGALSVRVDVMESTVPNSPDSFADKANELVMSFDPTVDEARRRAAVCRRSVPSGIRPSRWRTNLRRTNCCIGDWAAHTSGSMTSWSPRVSSRAGGAVMMLPIDPDADRSRRAWVACPACHHGDGCPDSEPDATAQFTGSTCFGMKARA